MIRNDFNESERRLQSAFYEIMMNPVYEGRGNRYYRVLFYIYMFGTVHIDDLNQIYCSGEEVCGEQREKRNVHRAYLGYCCKRGWLKRQKDDGYYMLDRGGRNALFTYLVQMKFLPDEMKEYFYRNEKTCSALLSHSSKTGRTVMAFLHNGYSQFLMNAPFDNMGRRGSAAAYLRTGMLVPDGFLVDENNDEHIYLEADSCEERMNSALIPKLQRYLTTVLEGGNAKPLSTIHFSIWSSKESEDENCPSIKLINDIEGLYGFIVNNLNMDLSFQSYYSSLLSYMEKNKYILSLKNGLQDLDADKWNISSCEELYEVYRTWVSNTMYSKQFRTRVKRIATAGKKIPFLVGLLYEGLRIVCMPVNISEQIIPYVYLEHYEYQYKIKKIISHELPNCENISFKSKQSFDDVKTGESITFRNIFKFKVNGKMCYVSVENISIELGAIIRVERYMKDQNFITSDELYLLCLASNIDEVQRLKKKYDLLGSKKKIFYVTYDEFDREEKMKKL